MSEQDPEVTEPTLPVFDPEAWDWTSNEPLPVAYWSGDERMPARPWPGTGQFPGHWDWAYQTVTDPDDSAETVVGRWPSWFYDPVPREKTPLELALEAQAKAVSDAEKLRKAILADQTAKPILGVTIAGVSFSVARRDSLSEVNARQSQMLILLQQVLAVQGNVITALDDAQERQAFAAQSHGAG